MKYAIDYQYLPKHAERPIDDGDVVSISFDSQSQTSVILPNVGDYVEISNGAGDRASFDGKVKSRLFRYIRMGHGGDVGCLINIVVQETDDDWGKLIKE